MTARRRNWILALGVCALLTVVGLFIAGRVLGQRFEPYIRQQAIEYLSKRFDSEVRIEALHIRIPNVSPVSLLLRRGRGGKATVACDGLSLRYHGRQDIPPIFAVRKLRFTVDLGTLFDVPKVVSQVSIEGLALYIPPRGERPAVPASAKDPGDSAPPSRLGVQIQEVLIRDAVLTLAPRDLHKLPLQFDIQSVRLLSAGTDQPMRYQASLTNAKPPGKIESHGAFGPWRTGDPASTPIQGEYTFQHADLGVFNGIGGTLHSTGRFEGRLSALAVSGEADVPDFRLKMSGNRVPLKTQFEVLVDGSNGNTILKPVNATLGRTAFTTSGGIIQHQPGLPRAITLDANIPDGDLRDLLRLAMKGQPFMEGRVKLRTKIGVPPLIGKVREKLTLDGRFQVLEGKFLRSTIQKQLDSLSRRAQGQPKNEDIDAVVSQMEGVFTLKEEQLHFSQLSFGVPGAQIELNGTYDMSADSLGFAGSAKLKAKVSEMMTGWKRLVLKPIDPIFARNGAGTFLPIKVEGTSKSPKFGLNLRGR